MFGAHVVAFDPATGSMVGELHAERAGAVLDRRPVARAARRPRRAARRCGYRQLLRRVADRGHRFPRGVSSIAWSSCRAAATAAGRPSRSCASDARRDLAWPHVVTARATLTRRPRPRSRVAAGPGRFECPPASLWIGRQPLGSQDANETTGPERTLRSSTRRATWRAPSGLEGRVGVRVTPWLDGGSRGVVRPSRS